MMPMMPLEKTTNWSGSNISSRFSSGQVDIWTTLLDHQPMNRALEVAAELGG